LLRRIAAELPHIGVDRSRLVERHFRSVVHMINAEEEEWLEVEGVGKVTAREVVEAVRKGEEENERL
jgi:ERCC4-type nuclease